MLTSLKQQERLHILLNSSFREGRDYLKKKLLIILTIFVFIILVYGIRYLRTPVNSQAAKRISEEVCIEVDAVFVRDEDVYTAPSSGYAYFSYTDGERVRKGARVANVYEGVPTESQIKQLATIDRRLKSLIYSAAEEINVDTNPDAAESNIDIYKSGIISSSKDKDISSVSRYKAMINAVRAGESPSAYIETEESLELERMAVDEEIGYTRHDVHSEQSGVFSRVLDGLEKVLTPDNIDEITIEELSSVYNVQSNSTENSVKKNNVMFKIVNNHEFYVLAVVDYADVEKYEKGKVVNLSFDNIPGEVVEGKIMQIKEDDVEPGKAIIFIRCQKYLEGAYSFRESKCKIIFDKYEGYKVPVYAIRINGDEKSVIAIDNNKESSYPVKILFTNVDEGYAIVDSVNGSEKSLDDVDYIVVGER